MSAEAILSAVGSVKPLTGWVSIGRAASLFSEHTAAWVDGFCVQHSTNPLLLVALSCVILRGSGRFSQIVRKYTLALTPKALAEDVAKVASRLAGRQKGLSTVEHTSFNYLTLLKRIEALEGWIVYLDPAWPSQLKRRTISNDRVYGLYASAMMSMLRQSYVPIPGVYAVGNALFWAGMKRTIDKLSAKNTVLVAYQTTEDEIDEVTARLGLADWRLVFSDRNASSKLREYLFCV